MDLQNKLQFLRKKNGFSQEELSEKLGIARQTISKWETGQAVPELSGLIALSSLYGISIDRLVKDDDNCNLSLCTNLNLNKNELIDFLIIAKKNTYASCKNSVSSCRPNSHDFCFQNENGLKYYDSYFGGEKFSGEEIVFSKENPIWSMNYIGRVIGENFSGDFLKESLKNVSDDLPFRGPKIFSKGEYLYHCNVSGNFEWFQGYEEIFYQKEKNYECYFHGGLIQ